MRDFFRGKQVTVAGANGLIGSYSVKMLREAGAFVRAIYHTREPNEYSSLANEEVTADLLKDDETRMAIRGSEVVINCAGITGGVGFALSDPLSYVGPATILASNILHSCYLEGVKRTCFISSTTVYQPSDKPLSEGELNMAEEPFQAYEGIGWSKRFLEKLCNYYHQKVGLKIGIVRPTGAYGRYDNYDERTSHVLPGMVQRALKSKDRFVLWGDGRDIRDFVHAEDVARGLLLATALAPNEPFNIGCGKGISTLELAKTILRIVESKAEIITDPSKPVSLRVRLVDIGKAREILGFEPMVSLEEGIRDILAWFQSGSK